MKRFGIISICRILILILSALLIWGFTSFYDDGVDVISELKFKNNGNWDGNSVVYGYVTSWSKDLPDPFSVTHLSYAFATIDSTFTTLTIKNLDRFKDIVGLKKQNNKLKVLLSIGGWGAGNFSEMAADDGNRTEFIHNLMNIVITYNLDGIDIDWEFPGSSLGKISSSKEDKSNFTVLMRQIRDSIGRDRVLTFASPAYGNYYDFEDLVPVVDFVNIMTYDMGVPPKLSAPLHQSPNTGKICVDYVVANHYKWGVPVNKMLIGIPFYGRGDDKEYKKFHDYRYIVPKAGTQVCFDSIAMSPYIIDSASGNILISYDDTTAVKAKCKYVKEIGARGVMFWHYCGDKKNGELLHAINSELNFVK